MEKQRVCKICSKTFSNGKTMGGHMRSHLAKFHLPPKSQFSTPPCSSIFSYRSVISSLSNSDADSHYTNYTKRRSKRRREIAIDDDDHNSQQVSSDSETFPAEDVALCLIKISKDNWVRKTDVKIDEDEEKYSDSVGEYVGEEDISDEEEETVCRSKKRPMKYMCDTCNKVFGSYQALGGHKASHKKMKRTKDELERVFNGGRENRGCKLVVKSRVFPCPFCVKVFDSGQALGGHKRVHFSQMGSSKISSSSSKLIDLNLPPSEYDDERIR